MDLVADEHLTEGTLLLGVVGLQFGHGLIVAPLDGQLEGLLAYVLKLKLERFVNKNKATFA